MSTKRSESWKKIVRDERGYAYCKNGCGKVCPSRARLYCSNECSEEYAIRNFSAYARSRVFERDHGVCALCGVETVELERTWERYRQYETAFAYGRCERIPEFEGFDWQAQQREYTGAFGHTWEMDHILPVSLGGGQCGLDNLRTLCIPCHRRVTRELREALARPRRAAAAAEIERKLAVRARQQPSLFAADAGA